MKKRNNNLTIILLIIIAILGVLCILFATDTIKFNFKTNYNENESNKEKEENIQKSTFGENDTFSLNLESGLVDVLGYIEVKEVYDYDNEKVNYAFFNIVDTKSIDFLSYIENLKGNSYVSEKAIGLGCISSNIISYYNSSDQYGFESYQLSSKVSSKIINSTKDNPVKLRLNKMKLTEGAEAPTCYSHITTVEIID